MFTIMPMCAIAGRSSGVAGRRVIWDIVWLWWSSQGPVSNKIRWKQVAVGEKGAIFK